MNKILINASNLHHGGGVQVASSFIFDLISDLSLMDGFDVYFYVSNAVHSNLVSMSADTSLLNNYFIFDVYGLGALKASVTKKFLNFDLVFTIFGPLYISSKIPNHIVGFAQPWILYPDNEISQRQSLYAKISTRLKFKIQWYFFCFSATELIVELDHVKNRLVSYRKYLKSKIHVVNNSVSDIYYSQAKWGDLSRDFVFNLPVVKIGYISRNYPHKNLGILLEVAKELAKFDGLKFKFYVTLTDAEWATCSEEYRAHIENVGSLTVAQCPTFYQAMDGVIFTSLLECFSATPLEALFMRRPLFASNRGFVLDCCGDHATYFEPLDPKDIAIKIFEWYFLKDADTKNQQIEKAYHHVCSLPNSKNRALNYMNLIKKSLRVL